MGLELKLQTLMKLNCFSKERPFFDIPFSQVITHPFQTSNILRNTK